MGCGHGQGDLPFHPREESLTRRSGEAQQGSESRFFSEMFVMLFGDLEFVTQARSQSFLQY